MTHTLTVLCGAVVDWSVKMFGLKNRNGTRQTYTLDRASYDSCATPGCHGAPGSTATAGVVERRPSLPLHRQVDGGKGHGGYGAYNEGSWRAGATASS